eukprot:m.176059 g.176059  ORF g.176059 m.176059 type:complete len:87 (-) comp31841_c1_seq5:1394-1654(-)
MIQHFTISNLAIINTDSNTHDHDDDQQSTISNQHTLVSTQLVCFMFHFQCLLVITSSRQSFCASCLSFDVTGCTYARQPMLFNTNF